MTQNQTGEALPDCETNCFGTDWDGSKVCMKDVKQVNRRRTSCADWESECGKFSFFSRRRSNGAIVTDQCAYTCMVKLGACAPKPATYCKSGCFVQWLSGFYYCAKDTMPDGFVHRRRTTCKNHHACNKFPNAPTYGRRREWRSIGPDQCALSCARSQNMCEASPSNCAMKWTNGTIMWLYDAKNVTNGTVQPQNCSTENLCEKNDFPSAPDYQVIASVSTGACALSCATQLGLCL